jgi:hypothetical protein
MWRVAATRITTTWMERQKRLVSRLRNGVNAEGVDAPGRQGATNAHILCDM